MAKQTFTRTAALLKIERILQMLSEQSLTAHELAQALPISKRHAQEYINHLHARKLVYISTWRRNVEHSDRMYPRPAYKAQGAVIRQDQAKPRPLNTMERKARAWQRVKDDPERYVSQLLAKRRYRSDKRGPRVDRAAAWITPANDQAMQEAA